ncbi:MAG: pilus assembly protein PilM [Desulfuromonadales bacterium]
MLFSKLSTGIEISPGRVTCALAGGAAAAPRIMKVACSSLPADAVRVSIREQNVLDPEGFVNSVRSAHNLLLCRSGKVSVTLPDSVGRIMLLDLEGRFKNRAEALDIIRWKLKKSIPFDLADTHLDYQQLTIRENGDMALLVALVSRTVISQYEELLTTAGLTPARIDFNSFNLYRAFERRLSPSDDYILISFYDGTLGITACSQGILEFIRTKHLPDTMASDNRVFMEISSSLLINRERFPDRSSQTLFCVASPDIAPTFQQMVAEAAGMPCTLLEIKTVVTPGDNAPGDQETLYPYTAAIGAALRSL